MKIMIDAATAKITMQPENMRDVLDVFIQYVAEWYAGAVFDLKILLGIDINVSGAAPWCKHENDWRNSPGMKRIGRNGEYGERYQLAMYRLFELVTEVTGAKTDYEPVLKVGDSPRDLQWLADELFLIRYDQGELEEPSKKDAEDFLKAATDYGLLSVETYDSKSFVDKKTGKPVLCRDIRIVGFERMLDEYTQRRQENTYKYGNKNPKVSR